MVAKKAPQKKASSLKAKAKQVVRQVLVGAAVGAVAGALQAGGKAMGLHAQPGNPTSSPDLRPAAAKRTGPPRAKKKGTRAR